ncbi:hypothetical protein P3X46_026425 [Hevea brasiliensis]|uniref:TF-B3 domain-containing protein n=1 Tax=Hevea brasiliensis TaxID=3981 RepID=A0ABQ9KZI0_HEVBR|nr:hypothetical protein P3X46_026425 [Hevea brasiliensis]
MSASQLKKYGHFYKLVVPSILQQNKLRIPKKFVRKFGDELSGVATLTVPDDRIWLVTLRQIDQKLWFYNGWHEFVVHYSICTGHFLVFRNEGNSNFSVHMYVLAPYQTKDPFRMTKTIKDYGKQHYVLDEIDDDDSVEILDSPLIRFASDISKLKTFDKHVEPKTTCENYNLPSLQNLHNEASHHPSGDSIKLRSPLRNSTDDVRLELLHEEIKEIEKTKRKKLKIDEENHHPSSAADIAKRSRESENSPESRQCDTAHLPSCFAKKHLNGFSSWIKLQSFDGKQWPVRCIHRAGSAKLSRGWYEFSVKNDFGEGDVCVFELLSLRDIVLKVTVFRVF